MNKTLCAVISALLVLLLPSCSKPKNGLRVAATPIPQAQMLDFVKPDLKAQGIDLIVVVTDDYNIPNRALVDHEVDANFFQHIPFMDEQIKEFHYRIESIAAIEIEPMGIYSRKFHAISQLPDNAKIALPNDPTNEARALILLEKHGIIELKNPGNILSTVMDITKNPKHIHFIEIDAAMLPRTLGEVDAAAINTNYALQAHLNPTKDALIMEGKDSPYANVITVRIGDQDRPDLLALKKAMTSEKMKAFILEKYQGAVIPAF